MEVQKVCAYCGKDFIARRLHTKACSDNCAKRLYKLKVRGEQIAEVTAATIRAKTEPYELLKAKEFLTVQETAKLLNSSTRLIYRLVSKGVINAVNLSERKTIIKRTEIDKLFALTPNTKAYGNKS